MAREANEERRTVTVRIEGRVQGVYYRAWTDETARALGLAGTVRNRDDGSVEAEATGERSQVDALIAWAHRGPTGARVTGVVVDWREPAADPQGDFAITR
jgi:acylphosphatase